MTALAFAVALAIMGRSAAADDAACRSGEPDGEASSLLQAQKVASGGSRRRASSAVASGGSCKTRNCGCGPYTDMGSETNCATYDMGPHCSQSETQCSICHGTWCPGSADDSGDPTPTPAPAAVASGGSCKTRNCGCGPYTDMGSETNCANYDSGPHCSQSETHCSSCHGIWCPGSADDSGDPTPTPAPAAVASGGTCKTRNCGCGPYTDVGSETNCASYDSGPHCSQSEAHCSSCHGIWCPTSSLLETPGAK